MSQPWHIVDGECFKKKFGSQGSALRFAASGPNVLYVYQCEACGAWHTSTRPTKFAHASKPVYDLTPVKATTDEAEYWKYWLRIKERKKPLPRIHKRRPK